MNLTVLCNLSRLRWTRGSHGWRQQMKRAPSLNLSNWHSSMAHCWETRAYPVYSEQMWPKKESANVNSRVSWLSITTRFPGSVSANMLKRFQKWCVKLSSCKIEVVQIHVVQLSTKDSNNIPDLAIALASWISTELPFALPLDVQLLPCLHETHLPW